MPGSRALHGYEGWEHGAPPLLGALRGAPDGTDNISSLLACLLFFLSFFSFFFLKYSSWQGKGAKTHRIKAL